jgi:hypothetical protein
MTDHDYPPLHQMVEAMLMTVDDYGPDADTLTIHFEALRAALATQPQPLFEAADAVVRHHDNRTMLSDACQADVWKLKAALAVAGSATPKEDT